MAMWTLFVGWFQGALMLLAQLFGGDMGLAILALTLAVRALLFPLTFYLARRSHAHQVALNALKPKLDQIKERFKKKPERMSRETMKAFREAGISPFPMHGLLSGLLQWPIMIAMFSAVRNALTWGGRFLWIPSIARPDVLLSGVVATLACLTVWAAPNLAEHNRALFIIVSAIFTFLVVSRLAAGLGLYCAAASVAGVVQSALLNRVTKRPPQSITH